MFFSGSISQNIVFGNATQLVRLYSQNKHAQNDETVTLGIYLLAENQQVAYTFVMTWRTQIHRQFELLVFFTLPNLLRFFFFRTPRKCNKFDEEGKWKKNILIDVSVSLQVRRYTWTISTHRIFVLLRLLILLVSAHFQEHTRFVDGAYHLANERSRTGQNTMLTERKWFLLSFHIRHELIDLICIVISSIYFAILSLCSRLRYVRYACVWRAYSLVCAGIIRSVICSTARFCLISFSVVS